MVALRSMTGFGAAERSWEGHGKVSVEARSVNARFLEIKVRQPHGAAIEHRVRDAVQARLGRGRIDVAIRLEGARTQLESLPGLLETLGEIESVAASSGVELLKPNALEILRFMMSSSSKGEGTPQPPAFLDELVAEALDELCGMRAQEGQALEANLGSLLDELETQLGRVRATLEGEQARLSEQLGARIEKVQSQLGEVGRVDPLRLAQEVAILVARADIAEELSRIESHLAQAREVIAAPASKGQGKTLDFLAQELMREFTTTGAKLSSHEGGRVVIEAKGTIERIREQTQNVE
jgi:uncharacterized protein (TIGR00255 family)